MDTVYTPRIEKESQARKIVNKYMWLSMGVSLIPVPVLDLAGVTALQLRMLQLLSQNYDVPFSKDASKKIVSALLGSIVPASLTSSIWSAAKFVPVLWPIAGLSMPAFAGAATYAIGKVFIQHFESGGTFLDFDAAKVQEYFRQEFDRGRSAAAAAHAEAGSPHHVPTPSEI